MRIFRIHPIRRSAVLALAAMMLAPTFVIRASSATGVLPFASLAPGFTQSLYATGLPFAGGVAFASNGDPLVAFGSLYRIDSSTTITQNGSTIHPTTPHSASLGLGLANALDGGVYANLLGRGVVKIDPGTGNVVAGPFGAPGNELGIALDPQTHDLVYAGSDGRFYFVSPDFSTQGVFSTQAIGADGIAFDPTGNFLFTSSGGRLDVLDRNNNLVLQIALANGACCTDGIAFHSLSPQFVISNNTDGTITRYDFPGNDYAKVPTQSLLASGGFRGDLLQVGTDGCAYLVQGNTRFADGTVTNSGSVVQLCPGFAPPVSSCTNVLRGQSPPNAVGATVNVRAIEVNQVVQDWCDSVPLVAGKPTLVRVHLQTVAPATSGHVSVLLQGTRDGVSLGSSLFPVSPGFSGFATSVNPITVTDTAESVRGDINSTANFWLPASWQSGNVRLSVVGASGSPLACDDPTSSPSACTAQVGFKPSPTLKITLAQGGYPDSQNGHCIYASGGDLNDSITRLLEIFPVAPDHVDSNVYTKDNANSCAQASPADKYPNDGSWKTDDFLNGGLVFSRQAHDAWVANGNSDNGRFFATVYESTTSAWVGTTGVSDHTLAHNTVFYYGYQPPYQDPYNAARYELGHELMHAVNMQHPGPWTDSSGSSHNDTLCGTPGESQTASPGVQVSGGTQYAFSPGMQKLHYFDWSSFNAYSDGYAYSLGPMYSGPDQEIYGLNTDAFYSSDLPQRIVVDPHHTFDMMSYCYGTYPRTGASKFQWITSTEYKMVLDKLYSF
jgi:hypothetical protein